MKKIITLLLGISTITCVFAFYADLPLPDFLNAAATNTSGASEKKINTIWFNPGDLNYTQDFEGDVTDWTLSNGTASNKWHIGTAAANGGTHSLYISSDEGVTNGYNNGSTSVVHAHKQIAIPAGVADVQISYDWRAMAESCCDYIRVWITPDSFTPTVGTQITAANSQGIQIGGNHNNNASWTTANNVSNLSAFAGQTVKLIFEWRNDGSVGSAPSGAVDNVVVAGITCSTPSAITSSNISESSATLSWTAPSGITNFDYYYATSDTAPAETATPSGSTTEPTATIGSLSSSTQYYFWVRSNCGTANGNSFWVGPITFSTTQVPATLPINEGFEGAVNWTFTNGTQVNKWHVGTAPNTSNSGTHGLYISNDNGTTNAYTINASVVTHAIRDFVLPAGTDEITVQFDWKAMAESCCDYIRAWIVPATFQPVAGTQITALANQRIQIGGNLNQQTAWQNYLQSVNVAALAGQNVRIVFEWRNDGSVGTQPPAAIDNVNIAAVTCSTPSAITSSNISESSATLSWTAPSGVTNFDYYYSTSDAAPAATATPSGSTTEPTATIGSLSSSTQYYFWVRSNCGTTDGNSFWVGPITFTTAQVPATLPINEGFEGAVNWTFTNGTQVNKWHVGTAPNTSNSGTHGLYISNDNGTTNAYTINASVVTHAIRDFILPAGTDEITVQFDWKAMAESCCDYIRAWIVPATFQPVAGTQITALANQRIQIGGNLNQQTAWQNYLQSVNVAALAGQNVRIVFEWRNDGSVGTQPPAAIDNVNIAAVTCPQPTNLQVSNATQNSAALSWTAPSGVANFDYYYSQTNTPPGATSTPTGTVSEPTVTIDGLTPSTEYYFWVRSNCGTANGNSFWVGPITFSTTQVPAQLDYSEGFEGTIDWTFTNGTQTNQWVVGTAAANSGTHGLYISNDNGTTNAYSDVTTVTHAIRDFALPADANEISIGFDWRSVGNSATANTDFLRAWLVPSSFQPVSGTQITTDSGGTEIGVFKLQAEWQNYSELYDVSANAGQNMRIIFEWVNNSFTNNPTPAALDNINIQLITCSRPVDVTITKNNQGNMVIDWTPVNNETQWEVYIVPADQPAPDENTVGIQVGPNSYYVYTEAEEGIIYNVYVRAICSEEDKSPWTDGAEFSDFNPPACADIDISLPDLSVDDQGNYYYCQDDGEVTINLDAEFDAESFKATTSYAVESIEYAPPFPFTGGTEMNITTDDRWSPIVNLPFDFCFFDESYDSVLVGSNGVITFTIGETNHQPDGYCPYSFNQPIPSTNVQIKNAIFGVYQDIHPGHTSVPDTYSMNYQVLGTYPCRAFVVSYHDVPLFSCGNSLGYQTYQIVIYEITNIIEVYVENRTSCTTFNSGSGLIGITNYDRTVAYTPPGRNTGTWSAQNEAWRFTPNGETTVDFGWYANGELISTDPEHTITINENTLFEAKVSYPGCSEEDLELIRSFQVYVSEAVEAGQPEDIEICSEDLAADLTVTIPQIVAGLSNPEQIETHFYESEADAENDENRIPDPQAYVPGELPKTVYVRIESISTGCYDTISFDILRQLPAELANPQGIELCVENNVIPSTDLTIFEAELLGQLENATGAVFQYYENEEDAMNTENPITNPENYTPGQLPQEIFVRISNIPESCDSLAHFSLTRQSPPELNKPEDIVVCVYYGNIPVVDLTVVNSELIAQYPDPSIIVLEFYYTYEDAENGVNQILDLQNFHPYQLPLTIYVKLSGDLEGCDAIVAFEIIEGAKNPEYEVSDMTICNYYVIPELPEGFFYTSEDLANGAVINAGSILPLGSHTLHINTISEEGCVTTSSYEINVMSCNIQKGISPNGDGLNDYLDLSLYYPQSVQIFNRHGKQVYSHGPGYTNQWQGQDMSGNTLPNGTYFYRVVTQTEEMTGYVQLIREIK